VHSEEYALKQRLGAESFRDVLRIQDRRHSFSVRVASFGTLRVESAAPECGRPAQSNLASGVDLIR
jgi:hypothetical protein